MLVAYLPCSAFTLVRGSRLDAELLEQRLLGAEEAHRQQHELRGKHLLGAGNVLRDELALVVLLPLDVDGVHALTWPLSSPTNFLAVVR